DGLLLAPGYFPEAFQTRGKNPACPAKSLHALQAAQAFLKAFLRFHRRSLAKSKVPQPTEHPRNGNWIANRAPQQQRLLEKPSSRYFFALQGGLVAKHGYRFRQQAGNAKG